MERERSLELLNATHTFPCEFTIKVIGKSDDDFIQRVVDAVNEAAGAKEPTRYQTRITPNGKHASITMEPVLKSAEHVLEVYERLKSVDGVVMTM